MLIRRAAFVWQFAAAIVLPLWLLVGWAIWGDGDGFLGLALSAPFLFLAEAVVAGVIFFRRSVRSERAVSWWDVGFLGVWHALVIASGFFGPATEALSALAIAAGLIAFWGAVWQLVRETRRRVRAVFASFERAARPEAERTPINAGEYIVIPPESPRP